MRYWKFVLARLHSLCGIVPVGAFLLWHLGINSFVLRGAEAYNTKVEFLRSLPLLLVLEFGFIIIPIYFHAIWGIVLMVSSSFNVKQYQYLRNWMYLWQRATGFIVLGFVTMHIVTLRFLHHPEEVDFYRLLSTLFREPLFASFYIIGGLASIFHFCNGIATFCITWGISEGRLSQRLLGALCTVFGVCLGGLLLSIVVHFW